MMTGTARYKFTVKDKVEDKGMNKGFYKGLLIPLPL